MSIANTLMDFDSAIVRLKIAQRNLDLPITHPENGLRIGNCIEYNNGDKLVKLNGYFEADELEALAVFIRALRKSQNEA